MLQAFQFFYQTQSFGTPIVQLIPPAEALKVRLTSLVYTPGATAHDLLFMRTMGQVKTAAAAAAAATSLVLDSASFAGQTLASGDYVVVEHADGTFGVYLVSALATLTITINALAKAVNSAANVWIMGAPADTAYHSLLKALASTRMEFTDSFAGLAEGGFADGSSYARDGRGDPALIYSANGTNAGILHRGAAAYTS